MFTLAEGGIELGREIFLLHGLLLFEFRKRRIHGVNLLIDLRQRVLSLAKRAGGGGDGLLLGLKLGEQGGALLLLLAYRALFGGDIGLNGFQLVAVIGPGI